MTQTPDWPTCVHGDGCSGVRWGDGQVCLAHLEPSALDDALAELGPGSDIDLRGTSIAPELLDRLLRAVTPDKEDARPLFGDVQFRGAQFSGNAEFREAQFSKDAWFAGTQFSGEANFGGAQFARDAWFIDAQFSEDADFRGA